MLESYFASTIKKADRAVLFMNLLKHKKTKSERFFEAKSIYCGG